MTKPLSNDLRSRLVAAVAASPEQTSTAP